MVWLLTSAVGLLARGVLVEYLAELRASSSVEAVPVRVRRGRKGSS